MPLVLEISLSIIYPIADSLDDGSIAIDIAPPAQAHAGAIAKQPPPPALATGPANPLYRLPQSLSSGGMKIHLNAYSPSGGSLENKAHRELARTSRFSMVDEDHILFEIAKAPVGADYAIMSFRYGKSSGGYGYGQMGFTSGWLSGGVWHIEYKTQAPGASVEVLVKMQVTEGGVEDGVWKLTEPVQKVVAKERPQRQGEFGENGRGIEILEEDYSGQGAMGGEDWRDFVTACWITKVWREATRKPLFFTSVRSGEAKDLRTW